MLKLALHASSCKFDLYTGGQTDDANEEEGLTHGVVLRVTEHLANAGRVVYTDNFYTSPALAQSLLERGFHLVGTIRTNRRGFPVQLKADTKDFEKHAPRGAMRYVRDGNMLLQQRKDRRVVSMLSTVHKGNSHDYVTRHSKVMGHHVEQNIRQPKSIRDCNAHMGGVDRFDQRAAAYRVLRRTRKYWKSIFLDMLDVAAVNSFLLFQLYRSQNPGAYQDPTSTLGRRSTPTWCVNLPRSTSVHPRRLAATILLQHNNLQLSICTWQLTESRRKTVSTAGTRRKWSGNVSLSAARARSTCTSLFATVLLCTTSPTSDMIP